MHQKENCNYIDSFHINLSIFEKIIKKDDLLLRFQNDLK